MSDAFRKKVVSLPLLLVLFLSELSLADVYETVADSKATHFGNRVCTNSGCTQLAARYILNRNEKVKPCNDFITHACGNYNLNHDHIMGQSAIVSLEAQLIALKRIHALLSAPSTPEDKPWHTYAKTFYKKCINTTAVWGSFKSDFRSLLDEIGGWPLLEQQWNGLTTSWAEFIAMIRQKYEVDVLFEAKVVTNPINSSEYMILLSPPEKVPLKATLMTTILELGGKDTALKELDTAFETIEDARKVIYENATNNHKWGPLKLLKDEFPNFDLDKYIRRLFDGIVPISENTTILVSKSDYFQKIHTLASDSRIFANYAVGCVAYHLTATYKPKADHSNQERQCMGLVTQKDFSLTATQMYVQIHFPNSIVLKVTEMIKEIAEELRSLITSAAWLDDSTRANALTKLAAMRHSVGFPENLFDDTFMSQQNNIPSSDPSETFLKLAVRVRRARIAENLAQINDPVDTIAWPKAQLQPNAFYMHSQNKIYITPVILLSPYFTPNVPHYVNFATIGAVIGHEIMHGFDDAGRDFDDKGNFHNWWTNATSDKFNNKSSCYVEQYTKEGLNGKQTLGENIADNVGMRLAYNAYKNFAKRMEAPEPALPGFEESTLDQVFFLAYANGWCEGSPTVVDPNDPDPHPPNTVRVKMVGGNTKEFSKAYSCSTESDMNPAQKCTLWL